MKQNGQYSLDYQRIEKAIQYIEKNVTSQPTLDEIADYVNLSKFHFERMFKRWAGISPIQFLRFLTLEYTKKRLEESRSILDAAFEAGLSGSARLHDLFINFEAMTPGEFKRKASGITITHGFGDTPFGTCLLARTEKGICSLEFIDSKRKMEALDQLYSTWSGADFIEDPDSIASIIAILFNSDKREEDTPFNIHIKGTNFQISVWKALLSIPDGYIVCYQDVASLLGNPKAYRAVASAIAKNPIAYLIPCHRVITKSGRIHQYHWGNTRKKAILGWERSHQYIAQRFKDNK